MGAIISYLTVFINIVLQLIYLPWMIDVIGKSQYALYTLATSFINLLLIDFGLGQSTSRFLAKYEAENKSEEKKDFISSVIKLYLFLDLIIFIVLLIIYFLLSVIYRGLTSEELEIYKKIYVIVSLYSIVSFPFMPQSGILEAHEKFISLKICSLGQKLLSILLTIIGLLLGLNVIVLVAANAISGIVFVLVKIIITRKIIPYRIKKGFNKQLLKTIFSFSVWVTISSIMARLIFNLAPSILGIVSNSEEIAIFSPASSIEGYFYLFAAAINGLFLPKISRYIANGEDNKIYQLFIKVGKYQMFILGMIFVGFFCVGKEFITLWLGSEFSNAWKCAMIIFIPDLLMYSQQIANTTLIAKDYVKYQAYASILMAVVCVLSSFVLSSKFGAFGAAIAISLGYFVYFIYLNIVYNKKLDFNMLDFYKKCYIPYLLPFFITLIVGYIICNRIIIISGFNSLVLKILIVVLMYTIMSYTLAFSKEEKNFYLKKIIARNKNSKEDLNEKERN